jgi:hypothetical protein
VHEFKDLADRPHYRRDRAIPPPVSLPGLWLTVFTAALAAILVGGLVVFLAGRAYLRWSIEDGARQFLKDLDRRAAEPPPPPREPDRRPAR